jgi:hypothetical protein
MEKQIKLHKNASPGRRMKIFILLFAGSLLLTFTSCKKWFGGSSASCKVKFFYLRYDSSAVAKWLATDKHTAGLVLQFYSTDGDKCDTAFGAISYAIDSSRAYFPVPDTLGIAKDSATKSFNNKIILGNNSVSRTTINKIFFKPDHTARSFDYILLVPKLDKFNNRHIVYELKVFKGNAEIPDVFLGGSESNPSPPAPPEI